MKLRALAIFLTLITSISFSSEAQTTTPPAEPSISMVCTAGTLIYFIEITRTTCQGTIECDGLTPKEIERAEIDLFERTTFKTATFNIKVADIHLKAHQFSYSLDPLTFISKNLGLQLDQCERMYPKGGISVGN